jgi:hypothetical protein
MSIDLSYMKEQNIIGVGFTVHRVVKSQNHVCTAKRKKKGGYQQLYSSAAITLLGYAHFIGFSFARMSCARKFENMLDQNFSQIENRTSALLFFKSIYQYELFISAKASICFSMIYVKKLSIVVEQRTAESPEM